MPKVSQQSATKGGDYGAVLDRAEELGEFTTSFVTFREDIDGTPLLKGLPDDRCQCPHWGYVMEGKWTVRYADHDEVYDAGDAFYTPPGHIPIKHQPGTVMVMWSPTAELRETEEAMARNMAAMQGA